MKPITVVGAGFSGLTLAYELSQLGLPVEVFEAEARAGGLISTREVEWGRYETAANALLANADLERLFHALKVEAADQLPTRRKRYIFWGRPRRWPLPLTSTLRLLRLALAQAFGSHSHKPRPGESVRDWAVRVVDGDFADRLLAPALQGIYAGDVARMSASMVVGRLFQKERLARGQWRGSVSPSRGMGDLIDGLTRELQNRDVRIHWNTRFAMPPEILAPIVLCTSAWSAEKITRPAFPQVADVLRRCESLPIASVTAFFERQPGEMQGFGCLFPAGQGFHALGALFNSCIFSGRSVQRSETWIFGGAVGPDWQTLDDSELKLWLLNDRRKMMATSTEPLAIYITRWPRALPHYTVEWEKSLAELRLPQRFYLHGNYLGQLGLAQIYHRSRELARELKESYGH